MRWLHSKLALRLCLLGVVCGLRGKEPGYEQQIPEELIDVNHLFEERAALCDASNFFFLIKNENTLQRENAMSVEVGTNGSLQIDRLPHQEGQSKVNFYSEKLTELMKVPGVRVAYAVEHLVFITDIYRQQKAIQSLMNSGTMSTREKLTLSRRSVGSFNAISKHETCQLLNPDIRKTVPSEVAYDSVSHLQILWVNPICKDSVSGWFTVPDNPLSIDIILNRGSEPTNEFMRDFMSCNARTADDARAVWAAFERNSGFMFEALAYDIGEFLLRAASSRSLNQRLTALEQHSSNDKSSIDPGVIVSTVEELQSTYKQTATLFPGDRLARLLNIFSNTTNLAYWLFTDGTNAKNQFLSLLWTRMGWLVCESNRIAKHELGGRRQISWCDVDVAESTLQLDTKVCSASNLGWILREDPPQTEKRTCLSVLTEAKEFGQRCGTTGRDAIEHSEFIHNLLSETKNCKVGGLITLLVGKNYEGSLNLPPQEYEALSARIDAICLGSLRKLTVSWCSILRSKIGTQEKASEAKAIKSDNDVASNSLVESMLESVRAHGKLKNIQQYQNADLRSAKIILEMIVMHYCKLPLGSPMDLKKIYETLEKSPATGIETNDEPKSSTDNSLATITSLFKQAQHYSTKLKILKSLHDSVGNAKGSTTLQSATASAILMKTLMDKTPNSAFQGCHDQITTDVNGINLQMPKRLGKSWKHLDSILHSIEKHELSCFHNIAAFHETGTAQLSAWLSEDVAKLQRNPNIRVITERLAFLRGSGVSAVCKPFVREYEAMTGGTERHTGFSQLMVTAELAELHKNFEYEPVVHGHFVSTSIIAAVQAVSSRSESKIRKHTQLKSAQEPESQTTQEATPSDLALVSLVNSSISAEDEREKVYAQLVDLGELYAEAVKAREFVSALYNQKIGISAVKKSSALNPWRPYRNELTKFVTLIEKSHANPRQLRRYLESRKPQTNQPSPPFLYEKELLEDLRVGSKISEVAYPALYQKINLGLAKPCNDSDLTQLIEALSTPRYKATANDQLEINMEPVYSKTTVKQAGSLINRISRGTGCGKKLLSQMDYASTIKYLLPDPEAIKIFNTKLTALGKESRPVEFYHAAYSLSVENLHAKDSYISTSAAWLYESIKNLKNSKTGDDCSRFPLDWNRMIALPYVPAIQDDEDLNPMVVPKDPVRMSIQNVVQKFACGPLQNYALASKELENLFSLSPRQRSLENYPTLKAMNGDRILQTADALHSAYDALPTITAEMDAETVSKIRAAANKLLIDMHNSVKEAAQILGAGDVGTVDDLTSEWANKVRDITTAPQPKELSTTLKKISDIAEFKLAAAKLSNPPGEVKEILNMIENISGPHPKCSTFDASNSEYAVAGKLMELTAKSCLQQFLATPITEVDHADLDLIVRVTELSTTQGVIPAAIPDIYYSALNMATMDLLRPCQKAPSRKGRLICLAHQLQAVSRTNQLTIKTMGDFMQTGKDVSAHITASALLRSQETPYVAYARKNLVGLVRDSLSLLSDENPNSTSLTVKEIKELGTVAYLFPNSSYNAISIDKSKWCLGKTKSIKPEEFVKLLTEIREVDFISTSFIRDQTACIAPLLLKQASLTKDLDISKLLTELQRFDSREPLLKLFEAFKSRVEVMTKDWCTSNKKNLNALSDLKNNKNFGKCKSPDFIKILSKTKKGPSIKDLPLYYNCIHNISIMLSGNAIESVPFLEFKNQYDDYNLLCGATPQDELINKYLTDPNVKNLPSCLEQIKSKEVADQLPLDRKFLDQLRQSINDGSPSSFSSTISVPAKMLDATQTMVQPLLETLADKIYEEQLNSPMKSLLRASKTHSLYERLIPLIQNRVDEDGRYALAFKYQSELLMSNPKEMIHEIQVLRDAKACQSRNSSVKNALSPSKSALGDCICFEHIEAVDGIAGPIVGRLQEWIKQFYQSKEFMSAQQACDKKEAREGSFIQLLDIEKALSNINIAAVLEELENGTTQIQLNETLERILGTGVNLPGYEATLDSMIALHSDDKEILARIMTAKDRISEWLAGETMVLTRAHEIRQFYQSNKKVQLRDVVVIDNNATGEYTSSFESRQLQ